MDLAGRFLAILALIVSCVSCVGEQTAHTLEYAPGKSITLSLPSGFDIHLVAIGLPRVRFFAKAPDGRIFATTMHDLGDNALGSVVILDGYDPQKHRFERVTPYLKHLRNPNSIAFYTDAAGQSWVYVALTDKVVRYRYAAGDARPNGPPETLIRLPDYGLHYKYGGWHLTRTLLFAPVEGKPRLFVSVGSSCNYCQEREVARASILAMDPDGKNAVVVARGVRNAVGLGYFPDVDAGAVFATDMGDDHLGDELPEDPLLAVPISASKPGGGANSQPPATPVNFGWPDCYYAQGRAQHDATPLPSLHELAKTGKVAKAPEGGVGDSVYGKQRGVAQAGTNLAASASGQDPNAELGKPAAPLTSCEAVPPAYMTFPAHSSPLGVEHFPASDRALADSFVVALHGASHTHIGSGYRVVRFTAADRHPQDFITGFLMVENGAAHVHGRPCGILRVDRDSFLLSDDYLGVVYFVQPR